MLRPSSLLLVFICTCTCGFTLKLSRGLLPRRGDKPDVMKMAFSDSDIVTNDSPIVIIGCGIAGLACAKQLIDDGLGSRLIMLEASEEPGGRIKTDSVDGYLLDRGFQVFIEEYPEAKAIFDYDDLSLHSFQPGARVRFVKRFHTVSDPFRRPEDLLPSLVSPIGSLSDKIKVGILSILWRFTPFDSIKKGVELDTLTYLKSEWQLSPAMIDRFFKPFYQGIFLSPLSQQSSKMFEFIFKMFAEGSASLPAQGMGAVAEQLAAKIEDVITAERMRFRTRVDGIRVESSGTMLISAIISPSAPPSSFLSIEERLSRRATIPAGKVVVAVDAPSAQRILAKTAGEEEPLSLLRQHRRLESRASITVYYGFSGPPPITDPVLILNGENDLEEGYATTINNICFPSQVSRTYAPEGQSLASVTIIGSTEVMALSDAEIDASVRRQLRSWWPKKGGRSDGETIVDSWTLLRIYRIPYAQPAQAPPYFNFCAESSSSVGGGSSAGLGGASTASMPSAADIVAAIEKETSQEGVMKIIDEIDDAILRRKGIYLCGDHIGSATLHGAISSGRRAARQVLADLANENSTLI